MTRRVSQIANGRPRYDRLKGPGPAPAHRRAASGRRAAVVADLESYGFNSNATVPPR